MEKIAEWLKVSDGSSYGSGSGDGSGCRACGSGLKKINGKQIYLIDETPTIIDRIKNNIAIGFILRNDLTLIPCYVVKRNNLFAHGETVRQAMDSLLEKLFEDMSEEERIEEFISQFPDLEKQYPAMEFFDWHNKLTGSCKMGRNEFAKEKGIDLNNDTMTVMRFIELTENSYGGEIIKELKKQYQ